MLPHHKSAIIVAPYMGAHLGWLVDYGQISGLVEMPLGMAVGLD